MEPIVVGLTLGLAAGISPGPLLTLVVSSTLRRGFASGLRVAAAPLVTDLPIVVIAIWISSTVPQSFLSAMSLVGGVFVLYLGVDTLADARRALQLSATPDEARQVARDLARDLGRGALVNVLSPHPWLFWFGIGGPTVVSAWRRHPLLAAGFLVLFYAGLVGSKVAIAALVARGRHALTGGWYRRLLASCGVLLLALGLALVVDGGGDLGWWGAR